MDPGTSTVLYRLATAAGPLTMDASLKSCVAVALVAMKAALEDGEVISLTAAVCFNGADEADCLVAGCLITYHAQRLCIPVSLHFCLTCIYFLGGYFDAAFCGTFLR